MRSASVLKARRDWSGAAASLRRAIALRPDSPASHYTLGLVLQLERRRGGRADRARRSRTAAPDAPSCEHEALVWTSVGIQKAGSGDLPGALDCFRRATSVFEPYAPAHYQMGLVLDRLGQHDASRSAFERARQLNPSLVSPRNTR